jgi:hypothetical protein
MVIYVFRAGRNTDPRIPGEAAAWESWICFSWLFVVTWVSPHTRIGSLAFFSFLLPPSLPLFVSLPYKMLRTSFRGLIVSPLIPENRNSANPSLQEQSPSQKMEGDPS